MTSKPSGYGVPDWVTAAVATSVRRALDSRASIFNISVRDELPGFCGTPMRTVFCPV